jgi:small neutral amino acid transporter SnatA (MarC family)
MQEQGGNANSDHDLAVFPLAVPSIASPGTNGAAILVRVMGLILAALSVQLVFEALEIGNWISTTQ